ncbi:MAG: glutamate dehydrogenase, partial [Geminicoccaceae bacterium]|nr:glutamate dehydrogenase [Geminicoccaceae bacterium]
MATRLQDRKADLLERVVDRLHDQLKADQAERAEAFLRHYYRAVSASDLLERDPLDLYGAALSHLRLGEHRRPGQAT